MAAVFSTREPRHKSLLGKDTLVADSGPKKYEILRTDNVLLCFAVNSCGFCAKHSSCSNIFQTSKAIACLEIAQNFFTLKGLQSCKVTRQNVDFQTTSAAMLCWRLSELVNSHIDISVSKTLTGVGWGSPYDTLYSPVIDCQKSLLTFIDRLLYSQINSNDFGYILI